MDEMTQEGRLSHLESDVQNIGAIVNQINSKLDMLNSSFVPRAEIVEMFRSRDKELSELREDIHERALKEDLMELREQAKFMATKSDIKAILAKLEDDDNGRWEVKKLWPVWIGVAVAVLEPFIMKLLFS